LNWSLAPFISAVALVRRPAPGGADAGRGAPRLFARAVGFYDVVLNDSHAGDRSLLIDQALGDVAITDDRTTMPEVPPR